MAMKALLRWLVLLLAALLALQLFFLARIALMALVNPHSSAFERSEAWRIYHDKGRLPWRQQWADYQQISDHLKRAVIASEDDAFSYHDGVDWEAMEKAWQKNTQAQVQASRRAANGNSTNRPLKLVGGSTITQQLAKNLLLSGERNLLRKGQELMLTLTLEAFLSKRRILEIYLNSVEWGDGIFGAEAAAQRYFRKSAAQLSPSEAARLAVMLPSPKFFETRQGSAYLARRTGTIVARMGDVSPP